MKMIYFSLILDIDAIFGFVSSVSSIPTSAFKAFSTFVRVGLGLLNETSLDA
jgi:hypothetical protein